MSDTSEPFVWGGGGSRTSMEARRRVAEALMKSGSSTAPVQHWTQGLARVAEAMTGAWQGRQLDMEEKAGLADQAKRNALLMGTGEAAAPATLAAEAPALTGSASVLPEANGTAPASFSEVAPRLKADLSRDFNLAPEQAAGVVGPLAHESGLFGTLQEIKPTIPGSRGGYGYAQWTGPRRRQFESWTAENGLDPTSYEANYGFLKHELANTSEGKVLDAVRATRDPAQVATAFTNGFLRPGIPAMGSRQKWTQRALMASNEADMPSSEAAAVEQPGQGGGFTIPTGEPASPLPMTGRTFNAISATDGPIKPVFQGENLGQPWMGTALPPQAPAASQIASTPMPPARPANLANVPDANIAFASGGVPMPVAPPQSQPQMPAAMPDLSNESDGGARELQVASEQQRQGQPASGRSPFEAVAAALMGNRASAPPGPPTAVEKVAAAMPPQQPAAPSEGVRNVTNAVVGRQAQAAPSQAQAPASSQSPRMQAAYATINSPFASTNEKAIAQSMILQANKAPEYDTVTRPDGSFWRVPKSGGAPVQVFGAQAKPEGPTGDMREYDLHVAQEKAAGRRPESFTDWARGNKAAGRTAINIDTKGAGKFAEKANEHQAKRYSDMRTAADEGVALRGDIEVLSGLLEGVGTGKGAEAKLGIAQMAKGMGLDTVADWLTGGKINEMEAAQSVMDRLTPRMRVPGSGATSDMEMRTFRNSIPSLGKQPGGNRIIGDTFRSMLDHQATAGDIAGKVLRGEIDQADADRMLKELPSPFARFKEYQKAQGEAAAGKSPAGATPPGAPAKLGSKAEFDALPPGSRFIDPTGQTRIKP